MGGLLVNFLRRTHHRLIGSGNILFQNTDCRSHFLYSFLEKVLMRYSITSKRPASNVG